MVDFYGTHQAGIATAAQDHIAFASFDVVSGSAQELLAMLDSWSAAAARLSTGRPLPGPSDTALPPTDTGEALGLGPSRLTLSWGVGPTLFTIPAGASLRRPSGLVALPNFAGDQLDPTRSDGDLCLQACADDPQVAFHAIHSLARIGEGVVTLRAVQRGFGRTSTTTSAQTTQRNLLGFKDGTNNLLADRPGDLDEFVWLPSGEEPRWMAGGSYLVMRRIRTRLELWGATALSIQEAAIGRSKISGAPLGAHHEHDRVDLAAVGAHGLPVIPEGAHIRVASPEANAGQRILRRGYSFADGIDPANGELDAGLLFISFQRDPRSQFVSLQRRLAANDALHGYLTHTASGLYACPRGINPTQGWGELLTT